MLKFLKSGQQNGFTLIELLVVIGILAVLLTIALVAINPSRHFQDANNTQRRSDVNAILDAVHQYAADNKGALPAGITGSALTLASSGGGTLNICSTLVPTYVADLPLDPTTGTKSPSTALCTAATSYNTGYTIKSSTGNRITVAAPAAEGGDTISITR
jgi:prepilin-type N-terminal cleavage/methylation domain-containing protein